MSWRFSEEEEGEEEEFGEDEVDDDFRPVNDSQKDMAN